MKKIIKSILSLLLLISIILGSATPVLSETSPSVAVSAIPSKQLFTLNGSQLTINAYNINGNNYARLRDVAMALTETESRFSVIWDSKSKSVNILSGESYTPVGGELEIPAFKKIEKVYPTINNFNINHSPFALKSYLINNQNYIKIRDLSSVLNFVVSFDELSDTVIISSKDYRSEDITDSESKNNDTTPGNSQTSSPGSKLKVNFNSNGGSEITAVTVNPGETLSTLPTPQKENNAFIGWYTDNSLNEPFYKDIPIDSNLTLYASYAPKDDNEIVYSDPVKFAEDCNPDYEFTLVSNVPITVSNLYDYTELITYTGISPGFTIIANGNEYTLSPTTLYSAGSHFRLNLLNNELTFKGETQEVRSLDYSIHKDEVAEINLQNDIKYVLWSAVTKLGEYDYTVPRSSALQMGDTVCFWDGTYNDDTKMFNIKYTEDITDSKGQELIYITTEDSDFTDVLTDLDLYFENGLPLSDQLASIDLDTLAENIKSSEGTQQLTKLLSRTLATSKSVQKILNAPAPNYLSFKAPIDNNDQVGLEIDDSLESGLTVTATVGTAINENFGENLKNDWSVLTVTFLYSTVLKGKVEINTTFTIKQYIHSSLQGYSFKDGSYYEFDYATNLYTETDIDLVVLVKSYDSDKDEYFDISEEIESLASADAENDGASDLLSEVLGAKGDDITLIDENLSKLEYAVRVEGIPIFQINFDLNFVVRVNFAAGISAHSSAMTARQIGVAGSSSTFVKTYSNVLTGDNRYDFDFYCAGYLGLKAGLKLSMSLSGYSILRQLGEVGVSGEVGAYLDLYGFMHFHAGKYYQFSNHVDLSLHGGMYMEIGIYLDISVFAKSEVFKAVADASLIELKFPLLKLGDRYILSEFTGDSSTLLMHGDSVSISNTDLLSAEYIDITTGETVTGMYDDPENFYLHFSTPYFAYTDGNIVVQKQNFGQNYAYYENVSPATKHLETEVEIYYTGSNLTFSNDPYGYAYKSMDLEWYDKSVDLSNTNDIVTATYVIDLNGNEQVVAEKQVAFAEIPGGVDLSSYTKNGVITGYDNDYTQAITKDTTYVIHIKTYQRPIGFITYHDGSWHFDVYPVYIGNLPKPPDGYDTTENSLNFTGFSGESRMQKTNELVNVSPGGINYQYLGLDPNEPIYSFSGTYADCRNAYWTGKYNGAYLSTMLEYLYTANYSDGEIDVTFIYPNITNTYRGSTLVNNGAIYSKTVTVAFNEPINPGTIYSYIGCEMKGWDSDGDGDIDYSFGNELPRAQTTDMTFYAVIEPITYSVHVQDLNGQLMDTIQVKAGNLPDIINTSPAYSGEGKYTFDHWDVSMDGVTFVPFEDLSDPYVFNTWYIKPVYEDLYNVTFDFDGGLLNSQKSITIQLPVGTYKVSEYMPTNPYKEADIRNNYWFLDWDCGDNFTVTGNMNIKSLYQVSPIPYTVYFSTFYGTLIDGKTSIRYDGDYDSVQSYTAAFLANHTTLDTFLTDDTVYTFKEWYKSENGTSTAYSALWNSAPRKYTVTWDPAEGTFTNGDTSRTLSLTYGSVGNFYLIARDVIKAADALTTYKVAYWKDQYDNHYDLDNAPYTVTSDLTFTAVYEADTPIQYTLILDANGGTFSDGSLSKSFTGTYGEATNIHESDPIRESSNAIDYRFVGWTVDLPMTFTESMTIKAKWDEVVIGSNNIGIQVTDGTNSEDISINYMDGYQFEIQTIYDYSIHDYIDIPVLVIYSDGLTFSGTSTYPIYIQIDASCNSVTFDNLTLYGSYDSTDLLKIIAYENEQPATIHIVGNCSFINTSELNRTINSERKLILQGDDQSTSKLTLESLGRDTVMCTDGLEVSKLDLNILARSFGDNYSTAITNSDGNDFDLDFIDSKVTAKGSSAILIVGNMTVKGTSELSFIGMDNLSPIISIWGEGNYGNLSFIDFTGSFNATYDTENDTTSAVQVTGSIAFTTNGESSINNYDLNGAVTGLYSITTNGYLQNYYGFVTYDSENNAIPKSNVHIIYLDNSMGRLMDEFKLIFAFYLHPLVQLRNKQ